MELLYDNPLDLRPGWATDLRGERIARDHDVALDDLDDLVGELLDHPSPQHAGHR